MKKEKKALFNTKQLATIGMMGAVAAVLMVLEFPVPLVPGIIKMDFSELPVMLCGFMFGPLAGFMTALIKVLLSFALNGTTTMGIGELANLVASVSFMLPAVLIYGKMKTKKRAEIGLIIGTIITSFVCVLSNTFVMFPVYAKVYMMSLSDIIALGSAVNPFVHNMFTFMLFSIFPFNILKYGVTSVLTMAVYKKLSVFLKKITQKQ